MSFLDSIMGSLGPDARVLLVGLVCGALGGLAQFAVTQESDSKWWQATIIGVVAAVGGLWISKPDTAVKQSGQAMLVGYFGRAVLAVLQTRVTASLERDQRDKALQVANDAVLLADKTQSDLTAATDGKAPPPSQNPAHVTLKARIQAISNR